MGGLARAVGEGGLIQPLWLFGGDASLPDAAPGPIIWWLSLDDPATRRRADLVAPLARESAGFAHRADAGERLIRRRLARLLLAAVGGGDPAGIAIDHDPAGAPVVTAPAGLYLSVAARWPALLIGVARRPLGVDLERVDRAPPALDLLTAAERDWLALLPAIERSSGFADCWATKEAHAKWSGSPRTLDPAAIETVRRDVVTSAAGLTLCWRRHEGELVAACAVAAPAIACEAAAPPTRSG